MKLLMQDIFLVKDPLTKLIQKDMPIKCAVKLKRLVKKLEEELKIFDEARMDLFKKYGEEQEDQKIMVKEENAPEFNKEFNDLASIEIEVDFEPISVEDFGDKVDISANDLISLEKIIV